MTNTRSYIINAERLPPAFPTHCHPSTFWEALGRVVATFGFLEEVLGKAIYAFTATRQYNDPEELGRAYEAWLPRLERALTDPLRGLIDSYAKAVREHHDAAIPDVDGLIADLQNASDIRNVLCHGAWRAPDVNGATIPLFVNRRRELFDTPIDVAFLLQVQSHAADLACAVVNTVTAMGWSFPGSGGPGRPIDAALPSEAGTGS